MGGSLDEEGASSICPNHRKLAHSTSSSPIHVLFPDRFGGRVQLRRGIHLRETEANAAKGGERAHC